MTNMLFDIPAPTPAPANPTPELADKPYKHSVVDSEKTPIETIASYIGGSNYYCVYYSQKLTKTEELKPFDPHQLSVYQQYTKINDFIIKLQGALVSGDDISGTGRHSLTGTAIITPHPNLKPNYGDVIIGDIGEGRAGQFTITSTRKLTQNMATAWEVEFTLERIADSGIVKLLDSKTVTELWYQKDYLITGQNPLLATEDYTASKTLNQHFADIANQYIVNFLHYGSRTLVIPGQEELTYDPFVVKAYSRLVTSTDAPLAADMRLYNCDGYNIPNHQDLYTAVIFKNKTVLSSIFKEFRVIDVRFMGSRVYQNPIRVTSIRRLVVPYSASLGVNSTDDLIALISKASIMEGLTLTDRVTRLPIDDCGCKPPATPEQDMADKLKDMELSKLIPKISNLSYVLSPSFYGKDEANCTAFEIDILKIVNNEEVTLDNINRYCDSYAKWSQLQQYYLTPLLLAMVKFAISKI